MTESVINVALTTVVANPSTGSLTDARLYINGALSTQPITYSQIGGTNVWSVTFTPNSTGLWSLHAFGSIQFRTQVVARSMYDLLRNVEDQALGSWQWDKQTGVLTMLRQDGTALATFNVADGLEESSRERV